MHPFHHALQTPDKPAVVIAETGETLTYRQLDERSNQTAHLYRKAGLVSGDVVAFLMSNGAAYFEAAWAAQRTGLYFVGIPTRLTAGEISYILQDSGSKLLIYSDELSQIAHAAAADLDSIALYSSSGEDYLRESFQAARSACPTTRVTDEAPGQDMLYSSGTTGRPKGVRRPMLHGPIDQETSTTTMARLLYGFDPATIFLSPAPLYHAAPLRYSMSAHQMGGTVVVMLKFDPEAALAAIERHQVTHAQWVPTHFVRMLKLPDAVRTRYDLSTLKAVFHAAAPCPVDIKIRMIDWWGPIVHEYYSSTEAIALTAATTQEWLERPGTVGRAKVGRIRICAEDGRELPARTEGTIYFSDGNAFEYFNDPERTRQAHDHRGWATIGDVGWLDEEGYLFLTDRKSYMIISGGVNIYPQEIEDALIAHPAVFDAAVIGAPDPEMGERVVAVVQPIDMSRADQALTDELIAHLRGVISSIKIPRMFEYVTELPREPTGKLLKRKLRDRYRQTS